MPGCSAIQQTDMYTPVFETEAYRTHRLQEAL